MARDMNELADFFKSLKFKKKLFMGVDETDVWKQLEKLQNEYRMAYEIQAAAYERKIEELEQVIASQKKDAA